MCAAGFQSTTVPGRRPSTKSCELPKYLHEPLTENCVVLIVEATLHCPSEHHHLASITWLSDHTAPQAMLSVCLQQSDIASSSHWQGMPRCRAKRWLVALTHAYSDTALPRLLECWRMRCNAAEDRPYAYMLCNHRLLRLVHSAYA